MENWVIGTKLVILLYCLIRYILRDMENIPDVLLFILLYICFDMLSYIFKRNGLKRICLLATCASLLFAAIEVNPLFALLLPLSLMGLASAFTDNIRVWVVLALFPVILLDSGLIPEYLLIGLLGALVCIFSARTAASAGALKEENIRLRDRIDVLNGKLDSGAEYENQVKYLTQLEERNSLAQKLHDRVGHTIAGSLIQLEAANLILDKDREKAGEILENVITHLKDGMENIRSTLRNIKPAPEQLGINRLKVLLEEFSLNHPIRTSLNYKGSLDVITQLQWKIITDNVKEALTNVLKYAAASSVKVDIEVMNKLVRAEVRDNGVGAQVYKKGLGMAGMEERAGNAGGKLIIDGSSGFSVITLLPVEVANADKSFNSR